MILKNIKALGTLGLLAGSALNSSAGIVLRVEASSIGGVIITGSGSIDVSSFDYLYGVDEAAPSNTALFTDYFTARDSGIYNVWEAEGYTCSFGSDITYDSASYGLNQNGMSVTSGGHFIIFGNSATGFSEEPPEDVFNFDFVLTDNDGNLDDYASGVIWSSNAAGANETVEIFVVPEPSSAGLITLGALGLIARRRR